LNKYTPLPDSTNAGRINLSVKMFFFDFLKPQCLEQSWNPVPKNLPFMSDRFLPVKLCIIETFRMELTVFLFYQE